MKGTRTRRDNRDNSKKSDVDFDVDVDVDHVYRWALNAW